jgi:hypothetical protein
MAKPAKWIDLLDPVQLSRSACSSGFTKADSLQSKGPTRMNYKVFATTEALRPSRPRGSFLEECAP